MERLIRQSPDVTEKEPVWQIANSVDSCMHPAAELKRSEARSKVAGNRSARNVAEGDDNDVWQPPFASEQEPPSSFIQASGMGFLRIARQVFKLLKDCIGVTQLSASLRSLHAAFEASEL